MISVRVIIITIIIDVIIVNLDNAFIVQVVGRLKT